MSAKEKKKLKRNCSQIGPFRTSNSRCQVDLIDFQSQPAVNYKFILIYQDLFTKCLALRPLCTKTAKTNATQVNDICLLFGAPCILQSDNGREFVNQAIDQLKVSLTQFILRWSCRFFKFANVRVLITLISVIN